MKKLLRYAMLWHRFLGIGICLFFGIWFVSGIVMMYARMPELTEADRLSHLAPLRMDGFRADVAKAVAVPVERVTAGMLLGKPVYRVLDEAGRWSVLSGEDGKRVPAVDADAAKRIAAEFAGSAAVHLRVEEVLTDVDQWTVYPASRPYLPFAVIGSDDAAGTKYYVSEATGSVYLVTTRKSRTLAWFGAIPHWWYIRGLRANTPLWRIVMMAASGIGVVMSLAGIVAGVLRYSPSKRYRFRGQKASSIPHTGAKRWHYVLGYGFGLFTFTWILSGLATMNPGYWSPGPTASLTEMQAFAGGPLETGRFTRGLADAAGVLQGCVVPGEVELVQVSGAPYYLARQDSRTMTLVAGDVTRDAACVSRLPSGDIVAAARRLPGVRGVLETAVLTSYDAYYYDRHDIKPLPVVRLQLDDAGKTLLYVNPRTGLIQARYTDKSRWERWLYNGLHSLDFPFLYHWRPVWDITVILLSVGGILLSCTGIWLSFVYVRKSFRKSGRPVRVGQQ